MLLLGILYTIRIIILIRITLCFNLILSEMGPALGMCTTSHYNERTGHVFLDQGSHGHYKKSPDQ